MTKKKAKKKAVKKTRKTTAAKKKLSPAQEGHQITFVLLGHLKRARRHFLVIAELLAKVRDGKFYEALGHADMQEYADKRLNLGRSSLFQYMKVYDWVKESHPEWLGDKAKGFIPDFNDISCLMWIEEKLKSKTLSATDRKELEALRDAGLSGSLRRSDLTEWRGKRRNTDTLTTYRKTFQSLKTRCVRVTGMPQEVLTHLDAIIELLNNQQAIAMYGFETSGFTVKPQFV